MPVRGVARYVNVGLASGAALEAQPLQSLCVRPAMANTGDSQIERAVCKQILAESCFLKTPCTRFQYAQETPNRLAQAKRCTLTGHRQAPVVAAQAQQNGAAASQAPSFRMEGQCFACITPYTEDADSLDETALKDFLKASMLPCPR